MASFDRLIETRWAYAVLGALVFLLALPGLFALPTLDRDEGPLRRSVLRNDGKRRLCRDPLS
jgi:hypothetical protein